MFRLLYRKIIFISRTGLIWTEHNMLFDCVELVVRHHNSAVFITTSTEVVVQLLALNHIDVTNVVVRSIAPRVVDWNLSFSAAGTPMISKPGHDAIFVDSAVAEHIIAESIY